MRGPVRHRAALVGVGIALAQSQSATGHIPPVRVGGLVEH